MGLPELMVVHVGRGLKTTWGPRFDRWLPWVGKSHKWELIDGFVRCYSCSRRLHMVRKLLEIHGPHTVRASVLLQPIIGFWCSVWCWKLPHAVVCLTLSRVSAEIALAMVVPIENPADREVRGVIRFLQADVILGYLAEETTSRVE